jgi:type IV secretion system protein TrbE
MSRHFIAEILPWAYPISEDVIRLRAGGTMIGFEIRGLSQESNSDLDIAAACTRFASSLKHFETGDFAHLIVHRIPATAYPERTFPNRAAAMVDYERARQFKDERYCQTLLRFYISNQDESAIANQLNALFFASTAHRMRGSRELQLQRFFHRIEQWQDVIESTLHPRRMTTLEMYRDLVLCVNGTPYDAPLPPPGTPWHHVIGQQDFHGGSTPRIGQYHIRPITLVYPWPKQTTEQTLSVLLKHPGELMLSCRFVFLDQPDAESVLKLEQKHFTREQNGTGIKQWFVNAFGLQKRTSANRDTEEQIQEIDGALSLLAKGESYGWASITALLRGLDADQVNSRAREVFKDLADMQHGARIEDAAAVEAIKGSWPGQGTSNERRPIISASNYAEIAMPIEFWGGTPEVDSSFFPKGTPAPLIVTGVGATRFALPSHIRSVGHTLIIGPTTGGKSTLLGAQVAALTALDGVRIVWLDRDFSSYVLTHAMGGDYIELATDNSSPLCPFQWTGAENQSWLFDFFVRLFQRWQIELNERQAADLTTALELAQSTGIRTMGAFLYLIHDPQMRGVLRNYVTGGQWGHIFDGQPGDDTRNVLSTYEMRHLDALGERASGPATELIVHDAEVGLGDQLTFVVIDEAKWILSSPVSRPWVDKALRTFRKYNAAMILATQSLAEIESTEVRSLLLESTAIKIFLPNRAAAGEHVRGLYRQLGLREKEIDLITEAIPQRDYLCTTEYGTRVFRLDLGPIGRALCASTGANDVSKARAVLEEYGQGHFLDGWLFSKGLGPQPAQIVEPVHAAYANGRIFDHAAN